MIYTEINFRKKKLMLCHVTMYLKKKILHGSDKNITSFYDGYWAILSLMVNVETLDKELTIFWINYAYVTYICIRATVFDINLLINQRLIFYKYFELLFALENSGYSIVWDPFIYLQNYRPSRSDSAPSYLQTINMETRPISPETEPRLKVGTCRLLLPHILITDFSYCFK